MTPAEIDALTLAVYRARLDDACRGDADRQVAKDGDGGKKQAGRSKAYRPVVLATLVALGLHDAGTPVPAAKAALSDGDIFG